MLHGSGRDSASPSTKTPNSDDSDDDMLFDDFGGPDSGPNSPVSSSDGQSPTKLLLNGSGHLKLGVGGEDLKAKSPVGACLKRPLNNNMEKFSVAALSGQIDPKKPKAEPKVSEKKIDSTTGILVASEEKLIKKSEPLEVKL